MHEEISLLRVWVNSTLEADMGQGNPFTRSLHP